MDTTQKSRQGQPRRSGEQRAGARSGAQSPQEQRRQEPRASRSAEERRREPRQEEERLQKTEGRVGVKTQSRAPRKDGANNSQRRGGNQPQRAGKEAERRGQTRKSIASSQGEITDLSNKRRAYGNSKPKKKSTVVMMGEAMASGIQRKRTKDRARRKAKKQKKPLPAVIYTEPKVFNRNRMMIQLLTVTAVVAAFVLGLSVYFKVQNITVSGADVYSAWSVMEASGISEGDSLLTFSRPRAAAKIKANLPYVKDVRFGIKLPDTVNIIIEEESVVYAIQDSTSIWWLMSSEGRVVAQAGGRAANYTKILGVTLENPSPDTRAVAVEAVPRGTDENGNPIPVTVTGSQRLKAALDIVSALEDNDMVGLAASVDVTRLEDMILWYGTRYQVNLGNTERIDYKIACMNDAILQMSEYQSGILDLSFTIWPDKAVYTPFG